MRLNSYKVEVNISMKAVSQLSEKCQKCPRVGTCNEKLKEMCAYMGHPNLCIANATMPAGDYAHADVLVKHDYRDIKIGPNITTTLDLEEVKRSFKRDIYRTLGGPCFEFGA